MIRYLLQSVISSRVALTYKATWCSCLWQEETGDQGLLNFAAIYTLLKGKTVLAIEQGYIEGESPVAPITVIDYSAARFMTTHS